MAPPAWYKWVILFSTCLSTFFAYGYISASTSIATVYYIQHYNERLISSIISSVNYGVMGISCLPALYLSKRIGNRVQQVIGGVLMCVTVAATSISTKSWQGLLLSGILAGIGGGLMQIATTNIIKEYFPGGQIGPFGAVSLTLNSASIAMPQLWTYLMETLGWQKAFLAIGGLLSINILCGLSYAKPGSIQKKDTRRASKPKLSLIPRKSSATIFVLPHDSDDSSFDGSDIEDLQDIYTIEEDFEAKIQGDLYEGFESRERSDSSESDEENNERVTASEKEDNGDVVKSTQEKLETVTEDNKENNSMWKTLKQPQCVAFVVMSGLYGGGITACLTIMGDYAVRFLNMSDNQVANALTIQGAMMIVSSLIYIFLTVCTEFCATLLHTVSVFGLGAAALAMAFIHTDVEFCILVGLLGFFISFTTGNAVPLTIELCGPERAIKLYAVKMLVNGICLIAMPLFAVYIQETVDEQAALYFSAASLFCAGALFLPFIKRFLHQPRVKSASEVANNNVFAVNHIYSYF